MCFVFSSAAPKTPTLYLAARYSVLAFARSLQLSTYQSTRIKSRIMRAYKWNDGLCPLIHFLPAHDDSIPDQHQGSSSDRNRQISEHSPNIDSDNPSTDDDSGRKSDAGRLSPSSAERPRKRKQRTTFSPIEVWELEKVFNERPYLMQEDEDQLVEKLGLTTRNVRVRNLDTIWAFFFFFCAKHFRVHCCACIFFFSQSQGQISAVNIF